jgi:hypothetical protein
VAIDAATGALWQDGCTGPMITRGALDFRGVEPTFPEWARYTRNWVARASRGVKVRGGPEGTMTMYFYNTVFHPFGANWGGVFAPTRVCEPLPPPPTEPPVCDPLLGIVCPSFPAEVPEPSKPGNGQPPKTPKP